MNELDLKKTAKNAHDSAGRNYSSMPDNTTIRLREASLIRSVFDYNQEPWGPNVTSAIAWMAKGELEDTSLHRIVEALLELKVKLVRMPTEPAVGDLMRQKIRAERWTDKEKENAVAEAFIRFSGVLNGMGQADSLPLSIQESEALDMIAWYRGKSLWRLVADSAKRMQMEPYCAVEVALELKEELEKSL